MSMAELPFLLR